MHLAFGTGGKSATRERQLKNLSSLMPGKDYDPKRCKFVKAGDYNSGASVPERGSDFASSEIAAETMKRLNDTSGGGHMLALPPNKTTSVRGQRYDEIILHADLLKPARGRSRVAHVFPPHITEDQMRASLPEDMQMEGGNVATRFFQIFTDHLLGYVDVSLS